jgi:type I restriction enzyme S subunit
LSQTPPEGWAFTALGDLSTYVTSGSRDWSKYYADHGALFVRTQDINQNKLASIDDIARVALPQRVEGKRTLIAQGDLLITITGANVGKCALVDIAIPEGYVSQSVALVRLAKGFSGRFIHRQLTSPSSGDDRTLLRQSAYGVGRPVLNLDNVRELPICLAPINEQHRIVARIEELLSLVNTVRDRLYRVPAILKRFRQAVLAASCSGRLTEDYRSGLFGSVPLGQHGTDQFDLPDSWECRRLEDVLSEPLANGRSVPDATVGFPVLRLTALKNGRVDLGERKVGEWTATEASRFLVRQNDFLVSRGNGSLSLVGRGGLVDCQPDPVAYPDTLIRVRVLESISVYYLALLWNSNVIRNQIESLAHTTAGIHKVSQKDLGGLILPIPPLPEQHEIVRRVEILFKWSAEAEIKVDAARLRANKLTQSILAKAFRGELVPTEAELARREGRDYEPASVLLDRIRERLNHSAGKTKQKSKARKASVNG